MKTTDFLIDEERYRMNDIILIERLKEEIDHSKIFGNEAFAQRSYQIWAIDEILSEINKSSSPVSLIVESFAKKMDSYSCSGKSGWIFSVAHDIALWILDNLLI